MNTTELVAYLRDNPTSDAMRQAADMIEAKEAKIARLRDALEGVLVDDLLPYLPAEYIAKVRAALTPQETEE